jgi:thiamine pyrophosphate-dependent acetolactate synthase large subunit-like protein
MIASNAPKNLTHVVIDNQVYESTGKQRSLSKEIDLAEVARGTGYKMVLKVTQKDQLKSAFEQLINSEGPSFLLIKVEPSFSSTTGRVTHTPEEIRDRFMESVA